MNIHYDHHMHTVHPPGDPEIADPPNYSEHFRINPNNPEPNPKIADEIPKFADRPIGRPLVDYRK
jgi:hypothetical protein